MPGVLDRLDEAAGRGLKTAVASSSERPWVEGMLGSRGLLPRFHVIATRGGAVRAKPEPDVYLAALAALGAPAARAVAFEDSANGVAAAKAAGLFCVAVPNEVTRRLDLSRADLIVPSLADVTLADLERRGFGGTGRRESSGGAGCRGGKPRAPAEGRA
jgi:beta-phosphoglucomutase-like phosphatase (HAD superfamily)